MTTSSHLRPLGIHGWAPIETSLLACILLGEPVCLISEPGAAKTYFGEVISRALGDGLSYGYYDSSKTNFEDFIGFPDPEAFKSGRAEFIQNELTIWDKQILMIDEISRVSRDTSNKWLEVLGSRMLLGRPLPSVVMLGAMNPVDHHATHLLDQAFADRFVAFLQIPPYRTMTEEDRAAILGGATGLDAPSLGFWETGETSPHRYVLESEEFIEGSDALRALLSRAAGRYRELITSSTASVVRRYADRLGMRLGSAGHAVEARRLKMLVRYVLASCAIELASGEEPDLPAIAERTVWTVFPHPYTGEDLPKEHLLAAHAESVRVFSEEGDDGLGDADHAIRFRRAIDGELSPRALETALYDLEHDGSLSAAMTAAALTSLAVTDSPPASLSVHAWSRIAARAVVEPRSVALRTIHPGALETLERTDGRHRVILAHASAEDDWFAAYEEAERCLDHAIETLGGAGVVTAG